MVPLTTSLLTIDYVAQHQFPVILVTSGRLGNAPPMFESHLQFFENQFLGYQDVLQDEVKQDN
jgi:hypothetical protein